MTKIIKTRVGIVGACPARLILSHLLAKDGIDSMAIDIRTRHEIETTNRAGILEYEDVKLLSDSGVSDRVLKDGYKHHGIDRMTQMLHTPVEGNSFDLKRQIGELDGWHPNQ